MKEAMFYRSLDGGQVVCGLCPHACRIPIGGRGICGVRENRDGQLVSLVYGRAIAVNVDPIEKKPLFHFLPGSLSLSIATVGCNLGCLHCQNSDISKMPSDHQGRIEGRNVPPEEVVALALKSGCKSISYTYTEPTVYFEYAFDTARAADRVGLKNIFVTNGYTEREPLETIKPWLHAANVDLKSFRDSFYRDVCRARLAPVLDTLRRMKALGIRLEVTTLVIPGLNDDEQELRDLARFLRDLDDEIPWHVSAFHPTYRMRDRPRTPVQTLRRAWEIGQEEGLKYVYTGNIPGEDSEHTYCPGCRTSVIERHGFRILRMNLRNGCCAACGAALPFVMDRDDETETP